MWSLSLKPPFVTTSLSGYQVVAFVPRVSVPIVMEGWALLCSLLPSVCPTLNIWPGLLTTFCKGLWDFGGATGVYFIKAISLNVCTVSGMIVLLIDERGEWLFECFLIRLRA